jgi:hypothetical protein
MTGTIVPGDHTVLMVAKSGITRASELGCLRMDHGFVSVDHFLLIDCK